jgi:hypothetical protein
MTFYEDLVRRGQEGPSRVPPRRRGTSGPRRLIAGLPTGREVQPAKEWNAPSASGSLGVNGLNW